MDPFLLPIDPDERSIVDALQATIQKAEALYGSVCFWSIGPGVLPALAALLRKPGSFCIVDIHTPTNVDKLHLFQQLGATLYLFFKELHPKRADAYLQRHLLHTKMLLFDLPGDKAELWVGSHNFTKQALRGINREASLVVACRQGDALYTQAYAYLQSILADPDCRPFDPNLIETYKRLQGLPPDEQEGGVYVLPLAWRSSQMTTLAQQIILLAGHDAAEAAQFAALSSALSNERAQLAVQAFDLDGGPRRKFTATLHNQGIISPGDPATYDITFGQRHLAVRLRTQMPFVSAIEQSHTREVLRQFGYWVSIRLLDELPADVEFEEDAPVVEAQWKTDLASTHLLHHLRPDPEEPDYPFDQSDKWARHAKASKSKASQGEAFSDSSGQTEAETAVRVARWLARARQRRYRSEPTEPNAVHALFQSPLRDLPDPFTSLDQHFQPANLLALRDQYELPLRQAFYDQKTTPLAAPDGRRGPQVRKLLKNYRVR